MALSPMSKHRTHAECACRTTRALPPKSAAQPAPHLSPPRLIGNTAEPAEFILPLENPNSAPGSKMDDSNIAASRLRKAGGSDERVNAAPAIDAKA